MSQAFLVQHQYLTSQMCFWMNGQKYKNTLKTCGAILNPKDKEWDVTQVHMRVKADIVYVDTMYLQGECKLNGAQSRVCIALSNCCCVSRRSTSGVDPSVTSMSD